LAPPSIVESSTTSILVQIVGIEKAEAISSALGGEVIYIPKKIREGRNKIIKYEFHNLLSAGATCMSSYQQLAKKHDLSPRRVMEIVNHAA